MADHRLTVGVGVRHTFESASRITAALLVAAAVSLPTASHADEILDWNAVMLRAVRLGAVPGPIQHRAASIVHAAMFDALNGIERRYSFIHVEPDAPKGASRRAAVVQAAYTALVGLFPSQGVALDADLEASLAGIADGHAGEGSQSIARGRLWGEQVALEILAWRVSDDLAQTVPPTTGNTAPGQWRPTPPNFAPMLVPNMGAIEPFVIGSVLDFRPGLPLSLTSPEYANDVNEVQSVGALNSVTRTPDQTEAARFWAGTGLSFWNRAAVTASTNRHLTLSENARLFALLNIAGADTLIVCWDSKLYYNYWRPITAIRLADTDGNTGTTADTTWLPLIATPPYPEYFSGHQSGSGAAASVLTAYFGAQPVEGFSEALSGVTRYWPSFAAAGEEAMLARVWSGIHFRFTQLETREVARQVAAYVLANAARPLNGKGSGQLP